MHTQITHKFTHTCTHNHTEARKKEIPIIQLNPGGVLNW